MRAAAAPPVTAADLELTHPADIAALLQELVNSPSALHLSPPGGGELQLQPLRLDGDALLLRLPLLQAPPAWLLAGPVQAHALLARVRIDFSLGERQLEQQDGRPVLRLRLPARLQRHQRRQSFRVMPLSAHHPRLLLPWEGQALRLSARDVSVGGMALRWPLELDAPAPGAEMDGVLEMSRELRIPVRLRVEHVQSGFDESIVGGAFVGLSPLGERQLLQHLQLMQRRQRALGS
jgi:c-di-GMP-binding flagellar brake protein YcgR